MITIIIILTLLSNCLATTDNKTQCQLDKVKRYLYDYGYLHVEDETSLQTINESVISDALLIFQEYYKLPVDGKLNNETLILMLKPRCGNMDIISDFRVSAFKWNKTVLSWHYYLANQQVLELTEKAFTLWEQTCGIRFQHDRTNPDILISNRRLKHMMLKQSLQCTTVFDGQGGALAHAYFPDYDNSLREIHIDEDEDWSYSTDNNVSLSQTSLFATLIHEIGHTLGLSHSDVPDSVMFAYYSGKIKLDNDDILAIQNLYGKSKNTSITPFSPTSSSIPPPPSSVPPITEDDRSIDTNQIDLCHFKKINIFLIANKRLHILYDKWLWIINTDKMTYSKPLIITDWLTFLPKNFTKVIAVYQRPSGEIVMFIDSYIYMFDITSLQIIRGYPKHLQSVFNIHPFRLHTVFNSYTGKTFIFHDDNLYRVIDECTFATRSWGYISETFPGIPPKIDSSFRYIDGNLYFFKNNTVYVFNEFTSELVKTERISLSIFKLKCLNDDILYKLKELISTLIIQKKKTE